MPKLIHQLYRLVQALIALMFLLAALALIYLAGQIAWKVMEKASPVSAVVHGVEA